MAGEEEKAGPVALTEQEMEQVTGGHIPPITPPPGNIPFAVILVEVEIMFIEWLATHRHP